MKSITSRSNPLVATFKALHANDDRNDERVLLDGIHLTREAESAGLEFECVAVSALALESAGEAAALARAIEARGCQVVVVSEPVLRAISPVRNPSGITSIARMPAPSMTHLAEDTDAFFLVLDNIQDPGNVGALIRVAEAAQVTQVLLAGECAHPLGWRALRGSMGSALRMPLTHYRSAEEAFTALRSPTTRVIAAAPRDGRDPDTVDWTGRTALVVGGEGSGLAPPLLAQASDLVTIPMAAPVESLNVAAAGAVLVYAARRQRRAGRASATGR